MLQRKGARAGAIIGAIVLCATLLPAKPAFAQATRTWVSGIGDDANPCSRTAPCKTFAGAISKTAANGEINALDPGGFGGVTITKSLTIDGGYGPGRAGALVGGTNAFVINAGPTDVVTLRNLDIFGLGTGLSGIRVLQAGAVYIEDVVIQGFNDAIDLSPPGPLGPVFVERTRANNNVVGVWVDGMAATLRLANSSIIQNNTGISTVNGGTVIGLGANVIAGNDDNGAPTAVSIEGSDLGAIDAVNDHTDAAVNGIVSGVNTHTDAAVNGIVSGVNTRTDAATAPATALAGRTNNYLRWVFTEGSTRGGIQEYLTLLSKTEQDVTLLYFTESGPQAPITVHLPAGVRTTVDVNGTTQGVGPEHDVSVEIVGTAPFYAERPLYFNRAIGAAGPVSGGHNESGQHD